MNGCEMARTNPNIVFVNHLFVLLAFFSVIMSMIRLNDFFYRRGIHAQAHKHITSQIDHNSIDLDACKIRKERNIKLKWVAIECHECMVNFDWIKCSRSERTHTWRIHIKYIFTLKWCEAIDRNSVIRWWWWSNYKHDLFCGRSNSCGWPLFWSFLFHFFLFLSWTARGFLFAKCVLCANTNNKWVILVDNLNIITSSTRSEKKKKYRAPSISV